MAVVWGRPRVDRSDIMTLGVDEIAGHQGHQYLTLVYQIDQGCRCRLWVGEHRRLSALTSLFDSFGRSSV